MFHIIQFCFTVSILFIIGSLLLNIVVFYIIIVVVAVVLLLSLSFLLSSYTKCPSIVTLCGYMCLFVY